MELHLGMKTRGGLGGMINCIAVVENFHQRVFKYNLENISISSNHLADQCYLQSYFAKMVNLFDA